MYEFFEVKKVMPKWQKYFTAYRLSPTLDLTSGAFVRGTKMFFRWEVFSIVLVLYSVDK